MQISQPPVLRPTADADARGAPKLADIWKAWFGDLWTKLSTLLGPMGGANLNLPYGAFDCTTTQTQSVINTPKRVSFDTVQYANGVTFVVGDGVHVVTTGLYLFTYSAQLTNADTQAHDVDIWVRKNGVDVPGSASVITVQGTHGGQPGYSHASESQLVLMTAGDYAEIWWASNSLQVQMNQLPAITVPFASPSAPALSVLMAFVSAQ